MEKQRGGSGEVGGAPGGTMEGEGCSGGGGMRRSRMFLRELFFQALGELVHELCGGRLDDADAASVLRDRARQRQIGVHHHLRSAAGRFETENGGRIGAAAALGVGALRRHPRRVCAIVDILELDDAGEGQRHRPEPHGDLALVDILARPPRSAPRPACRARCVRCRAARSRPGPGGRGTSNVLSNSMMLRLAPIANHVRRAEFLPNPVGTQASSRRSSKRASGRAGCRPASPFGPRCVGRVMLRRVQDGPDRLEAGVAGRRRGPRGASPLTQGASSTSTLFEHGRQPRAAALRRAARRRRSPHAACRAPSSMQLRKLGADLIAMVVPFVRHALRALVIVDGLARGGRAGRRIPPAARPRAPARRPCASRAAASSTACLGLRLAPCPTAACGTTRSAAGVERTRLRRRAADASTAVRSSMSSSERAIRPMRVEAFGRRT